MTRGLFALFIPPAAAAALVGVALAQAPAQAPAVQAQVADGQKVFEVTCATQYCHGLGGVGGQGPRLKDFPMTLDHVRATVREGRSGTPMAPFKDVLEPAQLESVIAYVLSISSGGALPTAPITASSGANANAGAAAPKAPEIPPPSPNPVAIGKEQGTPAKGETVFFDSANLSSCRTCHSYNKRGGPLGMDFADARKTPEEVLASVSKPRIAARAYAVMTVTTTKGEKLTGIRGTETQDLLQVYDVAIPPVRRVFLKTDVRDVKVSKSGIFDHTKLGYTHQQLLDVAALLGSRKAP